MELARDEQYQREGGYHQQKPDSKNNPRHMRRRARPGFRRSQMFRPYIGHGYPCVQEECFPALTTEFHACSVISRREP